MTHDRIHENTSFVKINDQNTNKDKTHTFLYKSPGKYQSQMSQNIRPFNTKTKLHNENSRLSSKEDSFKDQLIMESNIAATHVHFPSDISAT